MTKNKSQYRPIHGVLPHHICTDLDQCKNPTLCINRYGEKLIHPRWAEAICLLYLFGGHFDMPCDEGHKHHTWEEMRI